MPANRRQFLATSITASAATTITTPTLAADPPRDVKPLPSDPPPVRQPRATSGDRRHEPTWDERFTLSVGNTSGDLAGHDQRCIQAAIDSVARMGGGTVKLLPGTWKFRNSVFLTSNIRLVGSGAETIIIKEPSTQTKLSADSDWYDQEIMLEKPDGFRVGDGVCLRAKNAHHSGSVVIKRTLVARSGNRFKLDKGLRENLWSFGAPTAATLFPLLTGEFISNIHIENLTIDGNRANNLELDGNYGGCIFLQDCADITLRNVIARNNHGDGISWQICHDVLVEDCESSDHSGLGLHPGSGSQRPIMRRNVLRRNGIGLFFCWGVKFGLAEHNLIEDTKTAGISVGHRDTDNRIQHNTVKRSGQAGILFRPERGAGFTGDRCEVIGNTVIDTGNESAAAIDVQGTTAQLLLKANVLTESRATAKRVGIRLGEKTRDIVLDGNMIEGFAKAVEQK